MYMGKYLSKYLVAHVHVSTLKKLQIMCVFFSKLLAQYLINMYSKEKYSSNIFLKYANILS